MSNHGDLEGKSNFSCRKQDQWTRKNVKTYKDDPFWRHTGYIIAQMDGLYVGAMKRAKLERTKVRFPKSCSEFIL